MQSERSQHQNKDNAFKQLRAAYELELQHVDRQQAIEDAKADMAGAVKSVTCSLISPG